LGRIEAAALGYIARTKTRECDLIAFVKKKTQECDLIAFVRKTNKHENAI
jgi:hypothetical protein